MSRKREKIKNKYEKRQEIKESRERTKIKGKKKKDKR